MRYDIHTREAAPWHALITEAEATGRCCLPEDLERYLVALLLRHLGGSAAAPLAPPPGLPARVQDLQALGDHCLLVAGLHAGRLAREGVPVARYVLAGRSAYGHLAEHTGEPLFARLRDGFVGLMDVLHAMCELDGTPAALDPLAAFELWRDTGSRSAWRVLRRLSDALPQPQPVGTRPH